MILVSCAPVSGWRRMSLLVLYFSPSDLLTPDASFEAISNRLIVPPVVETLVYSKIRASVRVASELTLLYFRLYFLSP